MYVYVYAVCMYVYVSHQANSWVKKLVEVEQSPRHKFSNIGSA